MNFLVELGAKSVLLIAVVGLATFFLRKSSATIRHRVFALGFLSLAILPLLSLRMPEIRVERPSVGFRSIPAWTARENHVHSVQESGPMTLVHTVPPQDSSPSLAEIVFAIWAVGAIAFLGRTAYLLMTIARVGRTGEDLTGEVLTGLPPHTRVLATSAVTVPVTFGFVRPTVLVPQDWRDWPDGRLRAVLLHEWAHIRRGDWAWFMFASVVRDVYWPNPLTHWSVAKMRVESEFAADEAVLTSGISGPAYAETLVDLAESLRGRSVSAAIPFVEIGTLKTRVAAILSHSTNRKPLQRGTATALFFLVAAVMIPYAAVKMVAGPGRVQDGDAELADGSHVQVIAVTEMRGSTAISWDMHGALLKHPFPVDDNIVTMLNAGLPASRHHLKGAPDVRYVVFRLDHDDSQFLSLQPWNDLNEGDETWDGPVSANITDAIGGHYFVFRVFESGHQDFAHLRIKIPSTAWRLYAYQAYKNGVVTELLNPDARIRIAPSFPNRRQGTEATFVLPPDSASEETMARFWPLGKGESYFIELSGSSQATSDLAPEDVQRVEILTRPLRTIEFTNLPMNADPKATYVPHHFLPDGLIDADHGRVKLSDGTTIAIANLENSGVRTGDADSDGNPIAGTPHPRNVLDRRRMKLWAEQSLSESAMSQTLYDSEGWPLGEGTTTKYLPDKKLVGFSWFAELRGNSTDIISPVAVGAYQQIQKFNRNDSRGAKWSYHPNGTLHLDYPTELAGRWAGMEAEFQPLDANGKLVRRADQGDMTQFAPGWIEFYLTSAEAAKVTTVAVRTRPFVWIRFKNVSMELPKSP